MRKIKQLQIKVEELQSSIKNLEHNYNLLMQNLRTREFLIRTNFTGKLIKAEEQIKFKQNVFGNNNISFDSVCNQIIHYNFENIIDFITKLHIAEDNYINDFSKNKYNNYDYNDVDNSNNISGKTIFNNKVNKISNRKYKSSSIDEYTKQHPNEYFIVNIDKFYKKMHTQKYKMTKDRVISFTNAIIREKTIDNLVNALKISVSTLSNYLAILSNIGILNSNYTPTIKYLMMLF